MEYGRGSDRGLELQFDGGLTMDADVFRWVVGGLVAAIVSMAAYIVHLQRTISDLLRDRVRYLEQQLSTINLVQNAAGKERREK